MEINRSNINEIIKKSNAFPDKDYGQNFLIEPTLSQQIVSFLETNKEYTTEFLNIGDGIGITKRND